MGTSRSTLNAKNPTGCGIRIETGDTSGGTTIPQVAAVVEREFGINVEVRVGSNVASPIYVAAKLYQGHGALVQGNAGALLSARALDGTRLRSTGGYVNHAVWANEGRGWHKDSAGHMIPTEVLVYDPAADGRTAGWGKAATSPDWWPWKVFLAFLAALRPWGDNDSRTLGPGKAYCAIFPDTEPHVHLRFGGRRTSPFPRRMHATGSPTNVRLEPNNNKPPAKTLPKGAPWDAYQETTGGQLVNGSTLWYGDHNGVRWIHSSRVR
jgi:hypothetical protein